MERRLRTNLFLVLAVAGLVSLAWLLPEPRTPVEVTLFPAEHDLSRIEVINEGQHRMVLRRETGGWRMVEPVALPVDTFQMDSLLTSLRSPVHRRYSSEGVDLAPLGLAGPGWKINIDGILFTVGGHTAVGNRRYLATQGEIFIVGEALIYQLQRNPLDYAAKQLLPEGSDIVAIEWSSGARLQRAGNGWETNVSKESLSADDLQRRVDAWRQATAMSVAAADSVPRDGHVLIEFNDGGTLYFGVEMHDEEVLLTRDAPAVTYALPRDAAGVLLEPLLHDIFPAE